MINAVIGFVQEGKAEDAGSGPRHADLRARVMRGERHDIDAVDLVPGDVVLLEVGSRVPADVRLVAVRNLRIEEAALTGESAPVGKQCRTGGTECSSGPTAGAWPHSGTSITSGSGRGVVVATGEDSEVGGSAVRARYPAAFDTADPALDRLARQITAFTLVVGVAVFAASYLLDRLSALDSFQRLWDSR